MVDLEAFAAGCGVVSSLCGGTQEILGNRAEYVMPDSEDSIEAAVVKMLERVSTGESGCLARCGDKPVGETWEELGQRLAHLYRQCIESRS
jgi:glycosyltransferase involved in cell wall biosynthesis